MYARSSLRSGLTVKEDASATFEPKKRIKIKGQLDTEKSRRNPMLDKREETRTKGMIEAEYAEKVGEFDWQISLWPFWTPWIPMVTHSTTKNDEQRCFRSSSTSLHPNVHDNRTISVLPSLC